MAEPAPAAFSPAPPAARPLSVELAQLRAAFAEHPVTTRELIAVLGGRAYALLMILFALPFTVPLSIPGLSTPLGLIIAIIAVQLAFGRLPWLPRRLLDAKLPPKFFAKLVAASARVVRWLEKFLHPRLLALTATGWVRALHLFGICAAALLLALPLPIPFTNTVPGWAILLFACGLMERDGGFVIAGYAVLTATVVFFALLGSAVTESLLHMWHWIVPG